jgi:hypothetical protein
VLVNMGIGGRGRHSESQSVCCMTNQHMLANVISRRGYIWFDPLLLVTGQVHCLAISQC